MSQFKIIHYIWGMIILCSAGTAWSSVKVIDDKNNEISLLKPAQRIISLAPNITESLFAAGAGDKIVGVISHSDYPEAAKKITQIGSYAAVDLEKIISLNPDLVISLTSGNNLKQIEKLKALGIKIYLSEPRYPPDIANTIKRFGILAGTSDIANKASEDFLKEYQRLKSHYSGKEKVKVFYQIWNKPLMTIGGKHLITSIIDLCGGINVFSNLKTLSTNISIEAVITSSAEVIIAGGMGKTSQEWMTEWQPWPQLPAVKNNHIYFVNPDILHRVGPRVLQGADELCQLLEKARTH